ncbi:MAG: hypothetical protein QOH12_3916 [Solirubrobacteraceae bacterium]|nr:hypothetical protein [Solirubrobacteraceae bacterium]
MAVDRVEQAVVDYHASLIYSENEQDCLRQAVRDFIEPRVDVARKQSALHQRRLRDLQAEQWKLVQLAQGPHRQRRSGRRAATDPGRTPASPQAGSATDEVAEVMGALEDALLLVGTTLPYVRAEGPEPAQAAQPSHARGDRAVPCRGRRRSPDLRRRGTP